MGDEAAIQSSRHCVGNILKGSVVSPSVPQDLGSIAQRPKRAALKFLLRFE